MDKEGKVIYCQHEDCEGDWDRETGAELKSVAVYRVKETGEFLCHDCGIEIWYNNTENELEPSEFGFREFEDEEEDEVCHGCGDDATYVRSTDGIRCDDCVYDMMVEESTSKFTIEDGGLISLNDNKYITNEERFA